MVKKLTLPVLFLYVAIFEMNQFRFNFITSFGKKKKSFLDSPHRRLITGKNLLKANIEKSHMMTCGTDDVK